MIEVEVYCKSTKIAGIRVDGHAESEDLGKDLICAGVSTILFGTLNALEILCEDCSEIEVQENAIKIVVKQDSEKLQTILRAMLIQLETVKELNPQYCKFENIIKED